jgi:hypothetical protein
MEKALQRDTIAKLHALRAAFAGHQPRPKREGDPMPDYVRGWQQGASSPFTPEEGGPTFDLIEGASTLNTLMYEHLRTAIEQADRTGGKIPKPMLDGLARLHGRLQVGGKLEEAYYGTVRDGGGPEVKRAGHEADGWRHGVSRPITIEGQTFDVILVDEEVIRAEINERDRPGTEGRKFMDPAVLEQQVRERFEVRDGNPQGSGGRKTKRMLDELISAIVQGAPAERFAQIHGRFYREAAA